MPTHVSYYPLSIDVVFMLPYLLVRSAGAFVVVWSVSMIREPRVAC
jgi:hypothetical protein